MAGLHYGSGDVRMAGGAGRWTAPYASAKGADVDHLRVHGVGHDALTPLEVEAWYARPVFATGIRAPCRGLKARGIEQVCIPRVDGDVVDVLIVIQDFFQVRPPSGER